jgi:hypothetical protein
MTTKRKTKTSAPERGSSGLTGKPREGELPAEALARTTLRPTIRAAATITAYSKGCGDLELTELVHALSSQVHAVEEGGPAGAEAMLTVQAHTLDTIFNNLARRA